MLEGVVARLLNRWLGKYVLDLDTENLNVGIFSGQVQLTDLRLKPEALYELDLPIEIKFGTIGKICVQIPWNALLNQPVVILVEDVHVLAGPIVSGGPYDPERDKRLMRAAKKQILSTLEQDNGELIGGPDSFPEHLFTSLINNLQVTVQNVHVRYEDNVSQKQPLAVGLCISGITAETTNSRWKASSSSPRTPPTAAAGTAYHLVKLESVSVYWNHSCKPHQWDFEKQYYVWRNAMTHSLHTFSMNDVDFEFLIKPMTCKIKFIINKSNGGRVLKVLVDVMLQDLTMQVTREQFLSICAVTDSLERMYISRRYMSIRPKTPILTNSKCWWHYAYECVLNQRVRPYTWRRISSTRANYRLYRETYKRVLLNPNDTELKLDLQKYEDALDIVNVVIARQHAVLKLRHEQQNEEEYGGQEKSPSAKSSLWAMLPSPERVQLCRLIGYVETPTSETTITTSNEYHRIEHKYNLTIGNLTLGLMRAGREVLVLTLTQVLASVETAPGTRCMKISGRAEGMVLEGANPEDHLVPLISAEHHCNGSGSNDTDTKTSMTPNIFSVDYERCPIDTDGAGCRLWCSLEAVGIVFHSHAVAELLEFLEGGDCRMKFDKGVDQLMLHELPNRIVKLVRCALDKRVDLNLDIRVPYLVIPEYGTVNKSGSQLIIDLGRLVVRTELAPQGDIAALEDATQMELEEQLYSRLHIDLFHIQLLFCDSGENWRDARREIDTEMHLVSKMNMLLVFSSCVRQPNECGGLPEFKLNVTVPSLKVNISERKITLLLTYLEHVGQLMSEHLKKGIKLWQTSCGNLFRTIYPRDLIVGRWSTLRLAEARNSVRAPWRHRPPTCRLSALRGSRRPSDLPPIATERSSTEPSEHSEDASETWARCVDLPGLEDNVSPSNTIRGLSRVVLGEFSILLSRSSERVDRPYLMLRIDKTCVDLATMDYGPAVQLTIGTLTLTDKLHTSTTGQYLDLIHVPLSPDTTLQPQQDLLQVLYRKVRANCPDFRSHFHSVEKSLVADFGPVSFVVHRDALRTLIKYVHYIYDKVKKHEQLLKDMRYLFTTIKKTIFFGLKADPPVPPGAVKFSHSVRLASVNIRLCDTDSDLLELRLNGLETDIMFRANEKMVLRIYLTGLAIDHLAEVTLYTRVLTVDEDKVFEVKYVRHAPCVCRSSDMGPLAGVYARNDSQVTLDGSLRVHVGRVQVTLLYKLALQLHRFLEPLLPSGKSRTASLTYLHNMTIGRLRNAINLGSCLQLALYLHGPTILLPQKTASPNLVVVHTGELTIENFFKEYGGLVVENILIRAEGATVVRAVMTLASSLEMQEVMLEPLSVRLDVKRCITTARSAVPVSVVPKPPPWEIDGVIDSIKVTVGQRDLSTLLAVYADNVSEGLFVELSPDTAHSRPLDMGPVSPPPSPVVGVDLDADENVRSLESFFCQGEAKLKEVAVRVFLEEFQVSLFSDCEELLSSPVRDFSRGLCRLDIGEIQLSGDVYNDSGLEAKLSVRSIQVEDIRPDSAHGTLGSARILHAVRSSSAGHGVDTMSQQISISMPPVVDISFHQNRTGDQFIDVIMERICLQLSVPFVVAFGRFISDSIPCANRRMEVGGVVNHGYVGDGEPPITERIRRPTAGLTIALRMCRPELVILALPENDDPNDRGCSVVTRTEVLVDYSRHAMRENLIVSLSNFHILYAGNSVGSRKHTDPYVVLHPCDLEYSRNYRGEEGGTRANASVSAVQLHLCPGLVHTISDLLEELSLRINLPSCWGNEHSYEKTTTEQTHEELWLPKKMSRVYGSGGDDSGIDADEQIPFEDSGDGVEKENGETVLVASASSASIVLELEAGRITVPVVLIQLSAEATVHDWSGGRAHGTLELHAQANYYNGRVGKWEPLLEPVPCPDGTHRPWQLLVRVFKDTTPVSTSADTERRCGNGATQKKREKTTRSGSSSGSGDEEGDGENSETGEGGMVFLRAPSSSSDKSSPRVTASLAAFLEDSDTETEDGGTMERLASAICDLFTGDWNESDGDSDGGHSSESDQGDESPGGDSGETALERCQRPNCRTTSGLVRKTMYVLIDSRDTLNITITSETIKLINELATAYCCCGTTRPSRAILRHDVSTVSVVNDIGPGSRVELLRQIEGNEKPTIICSRTFEKVDSPPGSPDDSEDDVSDAGSAVGSGESSADRLKFDCDWSHSDRDPLLASLQFNPLTTSTVYKLLNQEQIRIEIPGFDPLLTSCPPDRSWSRLLRLEPPFKHHYRYHVFVGHETSTVTGRTLTVRSPLQLRNETCHALAVFYERAALQQLGLEAIGEVVNPFGGTVRIVVLEPHDIYNVPLHLAYHCRLHVRPVGADGHHLRLRVPSTGGIWWPELVADLGVPKDIRCDDEANSDEDESMTPFTLRAFAVEGTTQIVSYRNQQQQQLAKTVPNYMIRVVPPLCLRNRLPYAVVIHIGCNSNRDTQRRNSLRIEAGDRITTYNLDGRKAVRLQIELGYLGLLWTGAVTLTDDMVDDRFITMATEHDTDGGNKQLTVAIRVTRRDTVVVHLYSPYWIVNRTSLPLQIRGTASGMVYDSQGEAPILFVHKRRQRQSQRKAVRIRVYQSSWSAEFSLDAAGTAGLVVCRDRERGRRYSLLAACAASRSAPRLTRIITLLPNWLVCNNTTKHLRYMELNERTDLWLDLAPGDCCPFWPETAAQLMCVKFREGRVASPAFSVAKPHQTALRMDGGGVVSVEVSGGSERPLLIAFRSYQVGDAPVRVDNACADLYLKICQRSTGHVTLLSPYHSLLYTWDDPIAERTLVWNVYNNRGAGHQVDVHRDGSGEIRVSLHIVRPPTAPNQPQQSQAHKSSSSSATDSDDDDTERSKRIKRRPPTTRTDKLIVYWVCYMDGSQRTLLLTQERRTAEERALCSTNSLELCISLAGVGLSLCVGGYGGGGNELLHISLCDSPPIWEVYIAHRWKTLTLELASWLEDKFKSQQKRCQLKDYVLIDLEKMYMLKPFYGELRRTYHPAVWLEDRSSRHLRQRRIAINCIQVDGGDTRNGPCNILRVIPATSGSGRNNGANHRSDSSPCVEFICVARRKPSHARTVTYDSVQINIHEFEANLDGRLVERLTEILSESIDYTVTFVGDSVGSGNNFRRDMALIRAPLCSPGQHVACNYVTIAELSLSAVRVKLGLYAPNAHRHFIRRLPPAQPDPDSCTGIPLLLDYMYGCLEATYTPPAVNLTFTVPNLEMKDLSSDSMTRLRDDIKAYFVSRLMQQFHVQVLGADVLLNPYGAGEEMSTAVSPVNTITVPNELPNEELITNDQDLEKTARCLMGHVHGPTTLLLTQCAGEHLLRYSNEADRRRRGRYTPPVQPHLPETVATAASSSFTYGVTLSLYGLFHRGDLEGFFRGPGRALASLMGSTKSGSAISGGGGLADCTAVSLDAIRRAAFLGERSVSIVRQRLVRHCDHQHLGLGLYSHHEAVGRILLGLASGGQYSTDTYWAHAPLTTTGGTVLLITMQHVLMIENCRLWGPWDVQWAIDLDVIVSVPKIIEQAIVIKVRTVVEKQQKEDIAEGQEYKVHGEQDVLNWLRDRIEQAMILGMEDKCWSSEQN